MFVSALDDRTLEVLRDVLRARIQARLAHVIVHVSAADGEAIAALYREGEVVGRVEEDSRISLTAWVPRPLLGRLHARAGVRVEDLG